MRTVFRIKPVHRSRSTSEQQNGLASHRPRRAHRKSRRGCQNCKSRRVKCDENSKVGCGNCHRHGIDCDYLYPSSHASAIATESGSSSHPTPASSEGMSLVMAKQNHPIAQLYHSPGFASTVKLDQPDELAPIQQTLSFFETFTCSTVTTLDGLSIFKDSILALSHHCDFLMHAILGMAAAHLRAMNGIMDDQMQCQRFWRTESYHWHQAIKEYRGELAKQPSGKHVDTLITTSMLLGLHNFHIASSEDTRAPEHQRQAKLRWLVIPMGFPAVLRHIEQFIDVSAWLQLFNSAVPAEHGWTIDLETADGLFAAFLDLCGITPERDDEGNPYKHALMDLFALYQIERVSMRDMAQVVAFMSRLNGSFQGLLVILDSKALLILLYWLAVLDRLELWWAKSRAAQEARAIIDYLKADRDVRIRDLLEIPRVIFARTMNIW